MLVFQVGLKPTKMSKEEIERIVEKHLEGNYLMGSMSKKLMIDELNEYANQQPEVEWVCSQFTPFPNETSVTKCNLCGKEKWEHLKQPEQGEVDEKEQVNQLLVSALRLSDEARQVLLNSIGERTLTQDKVRELLLDFSKRENSLITAHSFKNG